MHLVRCVSVAAARFGRLALILAVFASISPLLAADTESDNTPPAEPSTGSVETSSADLVVDGQGTQIDGAAIYQAKCAECHGAQGEGRADHHDEPLYGDRSLASLAEVISETMPEENPEACVDQEALAVATYMYHRFYTAEARAKDQTIEYELARLTVEQYLNSVADLLGSFRGSSKTGDLPTHGLNAKYYDDRRTNEEKLAIERIDSTIDFDFGEQSPDAEKIKPEAFAIRWRGSLRVDETGEYQFCLRTQNGARLSLNDFGERLIDAWVSSGPDVREERASVRLLGGRTYPISIDFFTFKEQTASIELRWRPPGKAEQVIPAEHLVPDSTRPTFVLQTAFPPDDGSLGYERGSSVSKAWDQAATKAAIETMLHVVDDLPSFVGSKPTDDAYREKSKRFAEQFVERAFRRPLSDAERDFFVDQRFVPENGVETAIKQVVLLTLKSPRFLYPFLEDDRASDSPDPAASVGTNEPSDLSEPSDPAGENESTVNFDAVNFAVAEQLAYALWDSLPDEELRRAAKVGELRDEPQIKAHALRLIADPRAKSKLAGFFHHWLMLEEAEDVSKDHKAFPEFDELVLSDLRTSLELFVDDVLYSESSDFRDLLLADYLFLNPRLAQVYGHDLPFGTEGFVKMKLHAGQTSERRAGVLTHPYLLTAFAYHKSTSPIHRGVFLTRNVLGRSLNPPPMAIEFMDGRFDPSLTMREKVSELTKSVACQNCHSIINPLGFSLEHFDAIGRFRSHDGAQPINAESDFETVAGEVVRLAAARDVAEIAARSRLARRSFIQQLFHHLVKQSPAALGADTLDQLETRFVDSEYHMRNLMAEIALVAARRPIRLANQSANQPANSTISTAPPSTRDRQTPDQHSNHSKDEEPK